MADCSLYHKLYFKLLLLSMGLLCCGFLGCGLSQEKITKREEYIFRAQQYYVNQKFMSALQQCELALEIDPVCKRALIAQGWSFYYLKKYDDAENSFLSAQKLDDSDPWMNYGLGAVYYKKAMKVSKRINKILRQLANNTMPEEDMKEWDVRLEGEQQEKQKCLDKSQLYFEKSLAISSANMDIHKMLALIEGTRGIDSYPKAIENMDKYITLLQKEFLGHQELKKKREEERAALGLSSQQKQSFDREVDNLKAKMNQNREKFQIAQNTTVDWCYRLAIQAETARDLATNAKAKAESQKQMEKYANNAIERLELLVINVPEVSENYRNLAKIATLMGYYQDGIRYLKTYLEKYPLADPRERVAARLEIQELEKRIK